MGGPSSSSDPFALTHAITEKQLAMAKLLHSQYFNGNNSPEILGAIIQAVARNYATVVDNK